MVDDRAADGHCGPAFDVARHARGEFVIGAVAEKDHAAIGLKDVKDQIDDGLEQFVQVEQRLDRVGHAP